LRNEYEGDMVDEDFMGRTGYGIAALRKMGSVPANFRIFAAGWIGKKPEDFKEMRVTGAEFRAATRGKYAGRLCVRVPHTKRHVIVTREEILAAEPE
jgi:hypothetical protein